MIKQHKLVPDYNIEDLFFDRELQSLAWETVCGTAWGVYMLGLVFHFIPAPDVQPQDMPWVLGAYGVIFVVFFGFVIEAANKER